MVIYLRVSTEEQSQSGAGLAAQLAACRKIAPNAEVCTDVGISGAAPIHHRKGLIKALDLIEEGGSLVVARRDRLGRDALVMAMIERECKRKGARILSAAGEGTETDDPAGVLMRRIIDGFSEYERLIISARTKAALQAKKAKGERVGSIPYGYKSSGKNLIECEAEQKAISYIKRARAAGLPLRSIANTLERKGFQPRGGKIWHPQTVKNILDANLENKLK